MPPAFANQKSNYPSRSRKSRAAGCLNECICLKKGKITRTVKVEYNLSAIKNAAESLFLARLLVEGNVLVGAR